MGLDCSHNAWHGGYIRFHMWRKAVAEAAGLPPLELMEGFYVPLASTSGGVTLYHGIHTNREQGYLQHLDERLPIKWECLKPSPLHTLLSHSDCDGEIASEDCAPIADELEKLIPLLAEDFGRLAKKFVAGLREASSLNEPLEFG